MTTRCLICESSIVLSQKEARAIALLVGALNGFLQGIKRARKEVPERLDMDSLESVVNLIVAGLSSALSSQSGTEAFIHDIRKFQFRGYDCLCLRCGALFDEQDAGQATAEEPAS